MAVIAIAPTLNVSGLAAAAGSVDYYYDNGNLVCTDISQSALDAAAAVYDATVQEPPQSVTRLQARVALHHAGLLSQIEAIISDPGTDPVTVIAWQDAQTFNRTSPTLAALASALNLTSADLDALFIAAAAVEA
jgi:hypothetical protein